MNHVGIRCTLGFLFAAALATDANAYEFRVRFLERVGTVDTVLDGNQIALVGGQEARIRIQFGVFDDAEGAAPVGGYLGWNIGTITVNGGAANSDEFRNSPGGHHIGVGRLPPFNFPPGANGVPPGDPFEALTVIENTLGQQRLVWDFGSPQPQPVIRGLNTFVSTFELSVVPSLAFTSYTIDFGGNLISVLEWRGVSNQKPTEDEPGFETYAPFADAPRAFSATFNVLVVPTPGAAAVCMLGALVLNRRRR